MEESPCLRKPTTLYLNRDIENVCNVLARTKRAMTGLGSMFLASNDSLTFTEEELAGIGELFHLFSREIQKVENMLSQDSGEEVED